MVRIITDSAADFEPFELEKTQKMILLIDFVVFFCKLIILNYNRQDYFLVSWH